MRTRPLFILTAALINAALLDLSTASPTMAGQLQAEARGHYRMRVGAFVITALADGVVPMPSGDTPAKIPGVSVNGYLINTGKQLVLIDTGAGVLLGPGVGKLVGNLRAAGYQPEQVNEIYITHVAAAQIGGLLAERRAAFPNAIVRAFRAETDYWLAKATMAGAPVEKRQQFAEVAAAFKPYLLAGHLKTFDGETELAPGMRALPNAGRMPGQAAYALESGHEKILFCGDALQAAAESRDGSVLADAARTALFSDAAAHGDWVAGENLPFPGIGHVRADGHKFKFLPVSLDPNQTH